MFSARGVEQQGFCDRVGFVLQQPCAQMVSQVRAAGLARGDACHAFLCQVALQGFGLQAFACAVDSFDHDEPAARVRCVVRHGFFASAQHAHLSVGKACVV